MRSKFRMEGTSATMQGGAPQISKMTAAKPNVCETRQEITDAPKGGATPLGMFLRLSPAVQKADPAPSQHHNAAPNKPTQNDGPGIVQTVLPTFSDFVSIKWRECEGSSGFLHSPQPHSHGRQHAGQLPRQVLSRLILTRVRTSYYLRRIVFILHPPPWLQS